VRHNQVRKLVFLSGVSTLAALALMVLSILSPKPIYLVMAMSIGQGLGTISLALYLLAIVLDLQGGGAAYETAVEAYQEGGSQGPGPTAPPPTTP
jgi:ABC-type Na+ efflux pump permease subunit